MSFILLLSACSGNAEASNIDYAAEMTEIVAEATALREAISARETEAASTAVAAATYVVNQEGVNQQLVATLRVLNPPTEQFVDTSGITIAGMNEAFEDYATPDATVIATFAVGGFASGGGSANGVTFGEIGTALAVNGNGCAVEYISQFPAVSHQIYATAFVSSARRGTDIGVIWSWNGQQMFQEGGYIVPSDSGNFCLWFAMVPNEGQFAFLEGDWTVQFFANGVAVGNPYAFLVK